MGTTKKMSPNKTKYQENFGNENESYDETSTDLETQRASISSTRKSTKKSGKMKKAPRNLVVSTWIAALFAATTVALFILGALQFFDIRDNEKYLQELCRDLLCLNQSPLNEICFEVININQTICY